MPNRVLSYLNKLEGNARVCTALFPLWALPYTVYNFYLSLYLKTQGITDAQIGSLMIAANVSALACSLIASPIVDRLGRRWATAIFDIASSVLPPLLLLVRPVYPVALCALALTGLNRIMSIGYYLLLVEDKSEQNSVVAMNLFNLILVLAGFATPLAGIVVRRLGILGSEKLFLTISVFSMSTLTVTRHLLLKETETGIRARARARTDGAVFSPARMLRNYSAILQYILKERRVASAVLVNSLVYVYYAVGTSVSLLFVPYFTDFLRLSPGQVSLVGGTYAAGTLVAMTSINPRLTRNNIPGLTRGACAASLLGFGILVLSKPGGVGLILGGVFLVAVSYGVLKTVADSLLAIETSGERRAGVYAFSFFFSSALSISAIRICALLYVRFPGWLFIVSGILVAGVLICSVKKTGGRA